MNRKIRKRKVRQERKRETFLHFSLSSGFYTFFPLKNTGNRVPWFVAWPFDDGLHSPKGEEAKTKNPSTALYRPPPPEVCI